MVRVKLARLLVGAGMVVTAPAFAQLELGSALRGLARSGTTELPSAFAGSPEARIAVVAEYPAASNVAELLIGGRYRPLWLSPQDLARFSGDHPEIKLLWSPPRRPLMDEAAKWIGSTKLRDATGLDGSGVVVGIVDTGIDVTHRDLRGADGHTRVRYLLDFSHEAAGLQPDLEDEYGCSGDAACAIYSAQDIDALLDDDVDGNEPGDSVGHGTHVASLAAGNGLSVKSPEYVGVAPGAALIGARVSRGADSAIQDADILLATRFIFEQAERLGMPAVVNLSLGSDFGRHDGSSALEQGLASFVGPEFPGRAIVVAAGNSATLYAGIGSGQPEPYGIHTEVHVPRSSPVEVPLMTPTSDLGAQTGGAFFVWLSFQAGDAVSVGLDSSGESFVPDIAPGQATTYRRAGYEATIFNGVDDDQTFQLGSHDAVVIVDGRFDLGSVFTLRLSGHGSVKLWVESTGGVSPEISTGVLVPRAEKQGTINLPASHPDLIAVGATVNRNRWRDYKGKPFLVADTQGSQTLLALDGTASFSAAGPSALGVIKPDLIAPGMFVAGAMSAQADPRTNGGVGVFASQGRCGTPDYECFVTSDGRHAITSGTSMSAPLVSGAIAVLLERKPELTQGQLRALLQAGARAPSGPVASEQQLGPGELDLPAALAALTAEDSPIHRVPGRRSRIVVASSFAYPDPKQPLQGLLELRDDDDRIADGFDARRLELSATGAAVSSAPTRVAPGLYSFETTAPSGSGGSRLGLALRFDGVVLASRELPIGTDPWIAEGGALPHGGCGLGRAPRGCVWPLGAALLVGLARRRRRYPDTK